jgi:hypothetical protein
MSHVFRHPKYYEELRKQERKLTSSQAIQETVPHNDIEEANKPTSSQETSDKQANPEPKAQASSQSQQAPEFSSQRTSE